MTRLCGVMVITSDSESEYPSSNLGTTFFILREKKIKMIFGMFILEMIDIKNLNQAHNNKEYKYKIITLLH